ncbi:MAG: SpoIIE family protein phosphatase [Planctomycetota bacterium]|nr:SpoIIE family protein phosphatase [Planctomycetota bacterium]
MSRILKRGSFGPAQRAGRMAFAASAAVALYTAAVFGALIYAGLSAALACLVSAAIGVGIAALAGRVVTRGEEAERRRRVAGFQLQAARERAEAKTESAAATKESAAQPAPAAGANGGIRATEAGKAASQAERPQPAGSPAPAERRTSAPGVTPQYRREMRESREIQAALLPREIPFVDGYHLEVDYQPCGALGGDFYDFRLYDDARLLITLGDVSGKGPAGAIVMAMVQTLFREKAAYASGPADLLRRVNEGFAGTLGKGVFVTAMVGMLDPERDRLTLAGAGHHPVLLLNPTERRTTRVGARGHALGLVAGGSFANSLVETSIDLAAGDSLLLYTDGATDSFDDIADDVGENRLIAAAAAAVMPGPHGALQRLRDDLWQTGGRRDDTTMMLVSRLGDLGPTRIRAVREARSEA